MTKKKTSLKYSDIDWTKTKEITGTEAVQLAALIRDPNSIQYFKAAWKKN